MRPKLDENLGRWAKDLCRRGGHDVATVHDEGLAAASDGRVFRAFLDERRALVTLDLDFANPMRFSPQATAGIAVLRVPALPSLTDLTAAVETLLQTLDKRAIAGRLWVVRAGRVREYDPQRR